MMEENVRGSGKMIEFSQEDIDAVGEIANISFGSASTVLSTILNRPINISTPCVEVVDLYDASDVELPHVVLRVGYEKAIELENILVLKKETAAVIADLMMMGTGEVAPVKELTELELSAVKEAMNQMMGNAATAMSQLFNDSVEISPPAIKVVSLKDEVENLTMETQKVVKISFDMLVGDSINSKILQIISIHDAKKMVNKLLETVEVEKAQIVKDEETTVQSMDAVEDQTITPPLQATRKASEDQILHGVEVDLVFIFGSRSIDLKKFLSYEKREIIELVEDINAPVKMVINGVPIGYGELVNVNGHFGVRVLETITE